MLGRMPSSVFAVLAPSQVEQLMQHSTRDPSRKNSNTKVRLTSDITTHVRTSQNDSYIVALESHLHSRRIFDRRTPVNMTFRKYKGHDKANHHMTLDMAQTIGVNPNQSTTVVHDCVINPQTTAEHNRATHGRCSIVSVAPQNLQSVCRWDLKSMHL